jgi:hypothetical protein
VSAALAVFGYADARAASDPSISTPDVPSATDTLQEVTVTAQRSLAKSVDTLVNKITGPYFDGGIPRWGTPVCPLVSGLRPEAVESILARLADVARAAGVQVVLKDCHPNLYILVDKRPQELLRAMDSRNRWFTFGNDAHAGVVNEFVSTPGVVRVLYRDAPSAPVPSSRTCIRRMSGRSPWRETTGTTTAMR